MVALQVFGAGCCLLFIFIRHYKYHKLTKNVTDHAGTHTYTKRGTSTGAEAEATHIPKNRASTVEYTRQTDGKQEDRYTHG
jgi:hypothetical protein